MIMMNKMMNKMMTFLRGRVVYDEVDSDYSIIRAPVVQGLGRRPKKSSNNSYGSSLHNYNHNALYF